MEFLLSEKEGESWLAISFWPFVFCCIFAGMTSGVTGSPEDLSGLILGEVSGDLGGLLLGGGGGGGK